jgi:hypothetical protein
MGAFAERTRLKPGNNAYTPAQDVEMGRQAAAEVEQAYPMLNIGQVDDYLDRLGRRLAGYAPGEKFPYQFKCVNDASINAFALPGGFLFVNRGTIEAADNEAELAGVIGHEIGHVALRHGTNQLTKSQKTQGLAQIGSLVLGSIIGNQTLGSLAQLGVGLGANSVLLKYSRDAEREADLIGTQILYDAGYNPEYMAEFFTKLESGDRGSDFFSDHPNPDKRMQKIREEIAKLGRASMGDASDSEEFQRIKQYVQSLPAAPSAEEWARTQQGNVSGQGGQPTGQASGGGGRYTPPPQPSTRYRNFRSGYISLSHPDNWQTSGSDQEFALLPERGAVQVGNNAPALAYGANFAVHISGNRRDLKQATDQLAQSIQKSNPNMRLSRDRGQIQVAGQAALSRVYVNESPLGGREVDWLVTMLRPEGLAYFIFVAPEADFAAYQQTFQGILDSAKFQ